MGMNTTSELPNGKGAPDTGCQLAGGIRLVVEVNYQVL
jgi:hypothetical protein